MLDNIFFSWSILPHTDQLLGFTRFNNMWVIDEGESEENENKVKMKEGLSFGFLICRIDIIF